MNKSQEAAKYGRANNDFDLSGLPELPAEYRDAPSHEAKAKATGPTVAALTAALPNVVAELQANADRAVRPALTLLAHKRPSPSLYDRGVQVVRGLLDMYSVEDLDDLLLSCGKGEREVLLKSLLGGKK